MAKLIKVWDGSTWQDVAPSLPYTAIHSAQASMPATGVDGQVWLDTDGTLSDTAFVPLTGGTMTGNLNVPSINSGPIVGRNKVLNGDFSIWQRGTTATNGFLADRWYFNGGAATSFSQTRQAFTPGSAPISGYEGKYFWRNTITNVGSETAWYLNTYIEDVQTLAGQTATFSFFAKSDSPRALSAYLLQRFGDSGSTNVSTTIGTASVTTSWQRFTFTISIPSISGKTIGANNLIQIFFAMTPASGMVLDLWGIQLEAGNQATPFHTATPNQQTELAACQRYYEKSYLDTVAPGTASDGFIINGFTQTSGQKCMMGWRWTVRKRSTPTVTIYDRAGNSGKLTVVDIGGTPTDNQAIALISSDYNGLNYLGANNGTHTGFRFNWVADAEL